MSRTFVTTVTEKDIIEMNRKYKTLTGKDAVYIYKLDGVERLGSNL